MKATSSLNVLSRVWNQCNASGVIGAQVSTGAKDRSNRHLMGATTTYYIYILRGLRMRPGVAGPWHYTLSTTLWALRRLVTKRIVSRLDAVEAPAPDENMLI